MKSKLFIIILLTFVKCYSVLSQGLDASPAGIMISHNHPKDGWMVSYNYMNMMMKNNLSGTETVTDEEIWNNYIFTPHNMNMDMHMLMGMYGLTGRLSFMAMANYLSCSMDLSLPPGSVLVHHHGDSSMTMVNESNHSHETSGLGDIKLWILYKLLNGEGSSLVFSGGLNIPSGKFNIDANAHAIYIGERHPYMMQLGTGSLDFMPGLTYLMKSNNISWGVQALGTIRPFKNSIGYHFGNAISINSWIAYQFISCLSVSTRFEANTIGVIKGRDPNIYDVLEPDANPNNYGGQRVSAYIGLNFFINRYFMSDSKIGIEFGMPLYQNLNGPQLAIHSILNASITKAF